MRRQLGTVRKISEKVVAGDIFHATQALNAIGIFGHVHCSTVQYSKMARTALSTPCVRPTHQPIATVQPLLKTASGLAVPF